MTSPRVAYFIAIAAAVGMTALAAWVIIDSPGEVDDVGAYRTPAASGLPVQVTVGEGEGPATIGDRLEQAGAIESATQFRILVSLIGFDGLLQAGDYEFAAGSSALDVIYRMRNGLVSTKSVTVVEGWQLGEIADAVAAQGISREEFIAAASRTDYEYGFLAGVAAGVRPERLPVSRDLHDPPERHRRVRRPDDARRVRGQYARGRRRPGSVVGLRCTKS